MKHLLLALSLILVGGCGAVPAPPTDDTPEDPGAKIAAAVPDSDIFLAPLTRSASGWRVGSASNLTARRGYDNQPAFDARGAHIFFSSIRDGVQADVFRIDLATGAVTQVTATPESEYSPTPFPGGGFSTVRVEADGTQRLWRFDALGAALGPIRADITGVGYHAWLPDGRLALFIVDEPIRLVLAEAESDAAPRPVAENIGRALACVPGERTLSYVARPADKLAEIRLYEPDSGSDQRLTQVVADSEDLAWLPDGSILMGSGPRLYRWAPDGRGWRDFAALDVEGNISRLAVAPDASRLAVVVTREAP